MRSPLITPRPNQDAARFERGPESAAYDWTSFAACGFLIVPVQGVVAPWPESFKEFPIRQKPAYFNLEEVMEKFMPRQSHLPKTW